MVVPATLAEGNSDIELPTWFWSQPHYPGVQLAVGYSQPYIPSAEAFVEAVEDAALRLYADHNSIIAGERGSATVPEGKMDMGNTYQVEIDTIGFASFVQEVLVLDSMATPAMMIVIVGTKSIDLDRTRMRQPAIIDITGTTLPVTHAIAPPYYYLSSSWREAEDNGRIELAVAEATKIQGVGLRVDDGSFQATVFKTRVRLSDVRTVARRIDEDTGIVKVWITGRAESLID